MGKGLLVVLLGLGFCDWPGMVDGRQVEFGLSPFRDILPVPTKCPKKDTPEYTVHLAHEYDCTKFYKCAWGKKFLQDCPCDIDGARLYFNKYTQTCDWTFNVDCEQNNSTVETPCPPTTIPDTNITTKPDPNPSTDPQTTTPKTSPGILGCIGTCPNQDPPNHITALPHEDCRKWCRCQNHKVIVATCQLDFHFSPTEKICTTPETAGCV